MAESPPDLFVYCPLNADDMDILDASDILDISDEELAPLQAFVDEIKSDLSGDMEGDVEQVPEAPSAFLRSLHRYMKQIQEIHFDKYDSEWAEFLEESCTSPHCGKIRAKSLHGSRTTLFENVPNPTDFFGDDDPTLSPLLKAHRWFQQWGFESRHESHASFRLWTDEDDEILNFVPWFTRPLRKHRHPIVSAQISPGRQKVRNN